jgi:hypothetical protein
MTLKEGGRRKLSRIQLYTTRKRGQDLIRTDFAAEGTSGDARCVLA